MKKKLRRFQVLEHLVKQNGWTKGAEIGIYKGATFFHLLDHCPNLELIGVDNWYASETPHQKNTTLGLSSWKTPAHMAELARTVKAKAQGYPNATVYHADSVETAALVEDGSLDFVFIDAEHTTECVLADVTAWAPKVREGGWVLGHDEQWTSVRRALKQLFPKWTVHDDNVWSCP